MRVYMPPSTVDTSLIDWLPPGEAFYTRTKGAPGPWAVCIGDMVVADDMDKNVAAWLADQINAARGQTERIERHLLAELKAKYGE